MSSFVNVNVNTHAIHRSILSELSLIRQVMQEGHPCVIVSDDEHRFVEWAPEIVAFSTAPGLSHVVRRIILDACESGEKVAAGSSELILSWCVELADSLIQRLLAGHNLTLILKNVQNEAECFLKDAQVVARLVKENEFQQLLKLLSGHSRAASMVWEAIQYGGMESRIFVDSKTSDQTSIEIVKGHIFKLTPYQDVVDSREKWENSLVKVSVIDGFVEKVSEIHNILEPASTDTYPTVIFARGFSEEVLATLGLNRKRETLNVIPVRVPFDENSANTLKDLGVVCGTNVVSSLTGDLISSQQFDDLSVVDKITMERGSIIIHNESAEPDVSILIGELQKRRNETKHEALQHLLDSRLLSLTSLSSRIRCSHNDKNLIPQIDLLLRTSRAIVRNGVVDLNKWDPPDIFTTPHKEMIGIARIPHGTPVLTALATIRHGTQAALELLSINAALTIDRETK